MLTGCEGTGDSLVECISWPLPPFPPPPLPSPLLRPAPAVFTRRSCGVLSDKFTTAAGTDTTGLPTASGAETEGLLVTVAAETIEFVTDVLMEGPRKGVDAGTIKPVVTVVVVVANVVE